MRRLRRSILPEKQRKKGFFSKIRKRNKDPTNNHASSDNAVGAVEESHASNDWHRLLQLINILCTLYVVGRHVYTMTFRWGVFYPSKQTYFTPAPWAFYMWPVIHVLMLGNCIYRFSYQGSSILDQVGWKLPLLHISNGLYIRCWSNQRYKYAFVCIVVTYMVVNRIYRQISKIPSRDIRDWFFCHLLFSLYHAWVLGLMFLGAFEAFGVDAATTPAQGGTEVSVLFSLMLIQLFEWVYASPVTEGDPFACLVVSWFLLGITVEQSARSEFVHWITLVSTIFSLYWIAQCVVGLERTIRQLTRNPGTAAGR
ncbi:hypothetical protein EV363DRAFT_1219731 [Boletus edulis]|uniref:Uncharacterized protein n=1 Tax=Boletus edulis BED1 TaxID=1328754 RepID=A0AAD4GCK7_BOLED|nr:hypothetical protein EV363DRAFT_1219731 [Boletus edulis]KAF8435427.1 hypothetical protein L210DRAFT_3632402 [Boletus edulis BED1]